jgi:hypothetical protein
MAWCKKNHRYDQKFINLPFSEEYFGQARRWKCSGCAYEQGYSDGFNNRIRGVNLAPLDQSQAGTVRHTDPTVSYDWGYADGVAARP